MWIFRPSQLHGIKSVKTTWSFWPEKLHRKRFVEITWVFWPSKLHRKKYVEKTWIFRLVKLHQKKFVETTWIFQPSKLHRKKACGNAVNFSIGEITLKKCVEWRGNSSKLGLWWIDVIFTWNRRLFDVVCPLGYYTNIKVRLRTNKIYTQILPSRSYYATIQTS